MHYTTGLEEEDDDLLEQTGPLHMDLLTNHRFSSDHILHVTSYRNYVFPTVDTIPHMTEVPEKFVISFSYKPDINTFLRLFSVEVTSPPENTFIASTLLLSSAVTVIYSRTFYVLQKNITNMDSHHVLMYVNNGEITSCLDGQHSDRMYLWLPSTNSSHIQLSFSKHIRDVADRVCETERNKKQRCKFFFISGHHM